MASFHFLHGLVCFTAVRQAFLLTAADPVKKTFIHTGALICREYGPADRLEITTVVDPGPAYGKVLASVGASLNFPDTLLIQIKPPVHFIPDGEATGIVAAVGDGIDGLSEGDRALFAGATAWEGRYLVVGFASGQIPSLPLNLPLLKGWAVKGVFHGDWVERQPAENCRNEGQLFDWYEHGRIRPLISNVFARENFAEAFAAMAGRNALGKLVLDMHR